MLCLCLCYVVMFIKNGPGNSNTKILVLNFTNFGKCIEEQIRESVNNFYKNTYIRHHCFGFTRAYFTFEVI